VILLNLANQASMSLAAQYFSFRGCNSGTTSLISFLNHSATFVCHKLDAFASGDAQTLPADL
jgi:hypothetical protein